MAEKSRSTSGCAGHEVSTPLELAMSGEMLAVDPGLLHPAAALFRKGKLVAASRVPVQSSFAKLPVGARCVKVAEAIFDWWDTRGEDRLSLLVFELPQIYRSTKSKGDPNDLVGLAVLGGVLSGMFNTETLSPTPAEWIGQLPKSTRGNPWESPRGQRIARRLDSREHATITVSHDAIDAVGLGLWALGRLERTRVLPGAT